MIPSSPYVTNLILSQRVVPVPGAIVECGTWKGGMIAGIAMLLGTHREYFLYDSYEGLPPAKPIDGPAARKWQENTQAPYCFNNCTASKEDAFGAMSLAGISNPHIIKGWFEDTLPASQFPDGIALLRMDADWYDSTIQILNALFSSVNDGGLILIDDYYTWDGCSKAVHDYLSTHKRPERIENQNNVCFIRKIGVEQVECSEPRDHVAVPSQTSLVRGC